MTTNPFLILQIFLLFPYKNNSSQHGGEPFPFNLAPGSFCDPVYESPSAG